MRIELSMLDFDNKRFDPTLNTNMFITVAIITIALFMMLLNSLIGRKKITVPLTLVIIHILCVGERIMQAKLKGSRGEILSELYGQRKNF